VFQGRVANLLKEAVSTDVPKKHEVFVNNLIAYYKPAYLGQ